MGWAPDWLMKPFPHVPVPLAATGTAPQLRGKSWHQRHTAEGKTYGATFKSLNIYLIVAQDGVRFEVLTLSENIEDTLLKTEAES